MDHETVLIYIEKLNAAKEAAKTAAPHEPAFSIANQSIISIEEALRQSGLIQLDEQWVYPDTGWTSSRIIDLTNTSFKFLSEDFTARTINGRAINSFSRQDIDALRRDMLENKLILPNFNQVHIMSGYSYFIGLKENKTYMCQEGSWTNRMMTIDTPGGLGFRYYPEYIPMDDSKGYYRIRFCIAD